MVKENTKFTIDYTLGFPVKQWFINIIIDRKKVGKFCENLLYIVRDKRTGGLIASPNIPEEKTNYKFIWQIPWYGIDYAIKLGLMFDVDNDSLTDFYGFAAYGDASDKKMQEPEFTEKEIIIFVQEIIYGRNSKNQI